MTHAVNAFEMLFSLFSFFLFHFFFCFSFIFYIRHNSGSITKQNLYCRLSQSIVDHAFYRTQQFRIAPTAEQWKLIVSNVKHKCISIYLFISNAYALRILLKSLHYKTDLMQYESCNYTVVSAQLDFVCLQTATTKREEDKLGLAS